MPRIKQRVLLIVLGWFLVNLIVVGSFVGLGYLAYTQAKNHDLAAAHTTITKAQLPLSIFKFSSLGLYRLPGINYWYRVADGGIKTEAAGYELLVQSQNLLAESLSGAGVEAKKYVELNLAFEKFAEKLEPFCQLAPCEAYIPGINQLIDKAPQLELLLAKLPVILGNDNPKRYLILFQNNMELRPTGGFLGSYADITFEKGALKNLVIQDIYVPDGQIKGYVAEPKPIKEYLFSGDHPGWRLRDSNWNPDFPQAAADMRWFFAEGGVAPIDGIIALNLYPIIDALRVAGSIKVPDYPEEISADNFYQAAQYYAEHNFFPGSTQKKDFLSAIGTTLLNKLLSNSREYLLPLLPKLYLRLQQKQVMAVLFDPEAHLPLTTLGWDGQLTIPDCPAEKPDCRMDYLYINEANLGINKANCCIDRQFSDEISVLANGRVNHKLTLNFINHNPPVPKPPESWGGGYKNYLRLYLPAGAKVVGAENLDVTISEQLQSVGLLILTEGGQKSTTTISYTLPESYQISDTNDYRLSIQKQSGIEKIPFSFTFQGKTNTISLEKDEVIAF